MALVGKLVSSLIALLVFTLADHLNDVDWDGVKSPLAYAADS